MERIAKDQNPASIDERDEDDDIDFELGRSRVPFNRESFRRLVTKTFEDFYPGIYNSERLNLEEYVELIQAEQLELKFSVFLEKNSDNILNSRNMPWLDMGDLPSSYNKDKSEAF